MTELIYARATITKAATDGKGVVELLASMDIVDRVDEVVELSAWEEDVKGFTPGVLPILVDHEPDLTAGAVVGLSVDERGLFATAQLDLDSDVGQAVYEALLTARDEKDDMPGVSVGFEPLADKTVDGRRHITKARLIEVSILMTLAPAVPSARVLSVKSDPHIDVATFVKHAASPAYIQRAHDALVKAGAKCARAEENSTKGKADDALAEARESRKAEDPRVERLRALQEWLAKENDTE